MQTMEADSLSIYTKRRLILLSARESDSFALSIDYRDDAGIVTRRVVAPIRLDGPDHFLAYCLCRNEPRTFRLDSVCDMWLIHACDVLAPVEIVTL
jgi:predicted DNA-binding transcriptional regulator YafY